MWVAHAFVGPPVLHRLRVTISGRGHLPGHGGVILAANHRSFLDHFLLAAASSRPMRFVGKVELTRGIQGRFNMAMGMIPVDRGSADVRALESVAAALRAGAVVGIFPEGTRSATGELFRFRSGMVRIAADAGVPIVPVGLRGTNEVWPRGRWPRWRRPPSGLLEVRFGPLVPPPDPTPRSRRVASEKVFERVLQLCGQPRAAGFAPIKSTAAEEGA